MLAGGSTPTPERLEALKWLVHFVGDIHQPLHCEDDNDRGGNDVPAVFFNRQAGENLHHIWDTEIIRLALSSGRASGEAHGLDQMRKDADALNATIKPDDAAAWAPAGLLNDERSAVMRWANESHELARDVAYADLPSPPKQGGPPEVIAHDYERQPGRSLKFSWSAAASIWRKS